jgi:DNA recombination protein RmuC
MRLIDARLLAGLALILVMLCLIMGRRGNEGSQLAALLAPVVQQTSERIERALRDELTRSAGGVGDGDADHEHHRSQDGQQPYALP